MADKIGYLEFMAGLLEKDIDELKAFFLQQAQQDPQDNASSVSPSGLSYREEAERLIALLKK